MGRLTTHVLDTSSGLPAAWLSIQLWSLAPKHHLIKTVVTNSDGRSDAPLLQNDDLAIGTYELIFFAGDYLRANGAVIGKPPFLDVIPVRFGIDNVARHYHVPLLLSPYGYSTYRGS